MFLFVLLLCGIVHVMRFCFFPLLFVDLLSVEMVGELENPFFEIDFFATLQLCNIMGYMIELALLKLFVF